MRRRRNANADQEKDGEMEKELLLSTSIGHSFRLQWRIMEWMDEEREEG